MIITSTKKNFVIALTIIMIVFGAGLAILLQSLFPHYYFRWYPFIPTFFYLFGVFNIYMFDYCRVFMPDYLLNGFFLIRGVKMILSLFVMLFYVYMVKDHARNFVLTFLFFYFVFIVFETYFFIRYECNRKKKEKKLQNELD